MKLPIFETNCNCDTWIGILIEPKRLSQNVLRKIAIWTVEVYNFGIFQARNYNESD